MKKAVFRYIMDKIITLYQRCFNLKNAIFLRIDHEDATVVIVYEVTQPNGTKYILKICQRPMDYACELYFLNHFATKLPVPRIIKLIEPGIGYHGAILMQHLPGTLLKVAEFTDTLAYELAIVSCMIICDII